MHFQIGGQINSWQKAAPLASLINLRTNGTHLRCYVGNKLFIHTTQKSHLESSNNVDTNTWFEMWEQTDNFLRHLSLLYDNDRLSIHVFGPPLWICTWEWHTPCHSIHPMSQCHTMCSWWSCRLLFHQALHPRSSASSNLLTLRTHHHSIAHHHCGHWE